MSLPTAGLDFGCGQMPQANPAQAAPPGPTPPIDEHTPPPGTEPGPTQPTATEKVVQVSFIANRDELYSAWNSIANLADMAGKIEVRRFHVASCVDATLLHPANVPPPRIRTQGHSGIQDANGKPQ
jgi:hypothetical protein